MYCNSNSRSDGARMMLRDLMMHGPNMDLEHEHEAWTPVAALCLEHYDLNLCPEHGAWFMHTFERSLRGSLLTGGRPPPKGGSIEPRDSPPRLGLN